MCCYACRHYNIVLVDRSNDWYPESYRSATKKGITSICYRLRKDVPFEFRDRFEPVEVDSDSGVEEY